MIALTKERKKLMKEFPNLVDYESRQVFRHFYDSEPMPEATHVITDVEVQKTFLGVKKTVIKRNFRRSSPEAWQGAPLGAGGNSQGPQQLDAGAVLSDVPRDAGHPEAERGVFRQHLGGDVARGRQVRID